MSFISLSFIAFLLVMLLLFFVVPKRFQFIVLLLGSFAFYLMLSVKAFFFLFISSLSVYLAALFLEHVENRRIGRQLLVLVIGFNLFLLIGLKYFSFWLTRYGLVVPLGISFYTLSLIGYLIDIERRKYRAERNFFYFFLYVSYFPHILQGPIARYNFLGEQFKEYHPFNYDRVAKGCQRMVWGYMKKMIIADRAAIFVDTVFGQISTGRGTAFFIASLLYTIQIYADFSGCVDISMGVSEIFGIRLSENFKQPYLAVSINDFWKRWHISLSSWFRDYLYIPLGGSRKGIVRRWMNVLIVFTVSGFWHGVGINYIIWGLLHGIYQVIGYLLMPVRTWIIQKIWPNGETGFAKAIHILTTFFLVNFAWIFFRIADFKNAIIIIREIITDFTPWILTDGTIFSYGLSEKSLHLLIFMIILMFVVDLLHEKGISIRTRISRECLPIRWFIYLTAIYTVMIFGIYGIGYDASSFIYMNF